MSSAVSCPAPFGHKSEGPAPHGMSWGDTIVTTDGVTLSLWKVVDQIPLFARLVDGKPVELWSHDGEASGRYVHCSGWGATAVESHMMLPVIFQIDPAIFDAALIAAISGSPLPKRKRLRIVVDNS